jgi:hypothetical protein
VGKNGLRTVFSRAFHIEPIEQWVLNNYAMTGLPKTPVFGGSCLDLYEKRALDRCFGSFSQKISRVLGKT